MPNTNKPLTDGFATLITLALDPTIKLYEKEVTPPGITSGGPIEVTTMRSTAWRTNAPRQLKTLSPVSATVAYATDVIEPLIANQIGVNQLITITFPDDSNFQFWGWVEEFTPGAHVEGEQPTASLVLQPSNRNNDAEEVAPAYYDPAETPL